MKLQREGDGKKPHFPPYFYWTPPLWLVLLLYVLVRQLWDCKSLEGILGETCYNFLSWEFGYSIVWSLTNGQAWESCNFGQAWYSCNMFDCVREKTCNAYQAWYCCLLLLLLLLLLAPPLLDHQSSLKEWVIFWREKHVRLIHSFRLEWYPSNLLSNISIEILSFPLQDSKGWRASASRLADDLLKRRSKHVAEQGNSEQAIHQKEASYFM